MASGCIMGDCAKCGEFVYEDEWALNRSEEIIHDYPCKVNPTVVLNNQLRKEIERAKKEAAYWRERALKAERDNQLSLPVD